jgi:2-iminobutanoate/2-iminopropanoate deaminase
VNRFATAADVVSLVGSLALSAMAVFIAAPLTATAGPAANVEYFPMPSTGGPPLPFSEAVRVGDTLYVSGQIGVVPGTLTLVPGGIGPETHRVLDNIKAIVERHGGSMEQVVKCTVFLADIKEWPAFNEIYRDYFKTNPPARSALAASALAFNARTEVECIAFVPQKPAKH